MFFTSFIPKYINNKTVIRAYRILAWIKVPRSVREENYKYNIKYLNKKIGSFQGKKLCFIENQAQWGDIRFGAGKHCNMGYSGCEIIAAYNAQEVLKGPGTPEEMADMIRFFEAGGAALWGAFGTSPWAVAQYFRKRGFEVLLSYGEKDSLREIGQRSQVMIATVYNDRYDITKQIHTVCITRGYEGGYVLHNAYFKDGNGTYIASPAYETLPDAISHISGFQTKLICLMGFIREPVNPLEKPKSQC